MGKKQPKINYRKKGKSPINHQIVKETSKREYSTGGGIKEEKITIKKEG